MRPILQAGSLCVLFVLANAVARGQDNAPPPLTAPGEASPIVNPPVLTPTPAPPTFNRTPSSLLRPKPTTELSTRRMPRLEKTPVAVEDLPPPLDAPSEMRMTERATNNGAGSIVSTPDMGRPPALVLEPGPDDLPAPGRTKGKVELERIKPELPADKKPKRFSFFSKLQAPRLGPPVPEDDSVRVEPRNDPAADAALKRRLETKIAAAVGDKARNIEVRVVDRNVTVKAKVDRFWNRRPVRKTIETLPALSGYRTQIDVDD